MLCLNVFFSWLKDLAPDRCVHFRQPEPLRDEVLKCLGNRPGILQARAIGERIIFKMKEFVEVFEKGMVA
jgi:hypothetical protein